MGSIRALVRQDLDAAEREQRPLDETIADAPAGDPVGDAQPPPGALGRSHELRLEAAGGERLLHPLRRSIVGGAHAVLVVRPGPREPPRLLQVVPTRSAPEQHAQEHPEVSAPVLREVVDERHPQVVLDRMQVRGKAVEGGTVRRGHARDLREHWLELRHVLEHLVGEHVVELTVGERGVGRWLDHPQDRLVLPPVPQQLAAPLHVRVLDVDAARLVAPVAQPEDGLATPAAPVEHARLLGTQAETLPAGLEIADDVGMDVVPGHVLLGERLPLVDHRGKLVPVGAPVNVRSGREPNARSP